MKNTFILLTFFMLACCLNTAHSQTNNSNSNNTGNGNNVNGSGNLQNPVVVPAPPNKTVMPVTAPQGTEPNNRVMLRSQTDSMDSKRGSPPGHVRMSNDTIRNERILIRKDDPIAYPPDRDSLK